MTLPFPNCYLAFPFLIQALVLGKTPNWAGNYAQESNSFRYRFWKNRFKNSFIHPRFILLFVTKRFCYHDSPLQGTRNQHRCYLPRVRCIPRGSNRVLCFSNSYFLLLLLPLLSSCYLRPPYKKTNTVKKNIYIYIYRSVLKNLPQMGQNFTVDCAQ